MLLSVFFALMVGWSGRGMDLNPELLSAIDRLCVGLVVQCMFQCRVHNLNFGSLFLFWFQLWVSFLVLVLTLGFFSCFGFNFGFLFLFWF